MFYKPQSSPTPHAHPSHNPSVPNVPQPRSQCPGLPQPRQNARIGGACPGDGRIRDRHQPPHHQPPHLRRAGRKQIRQPPPAVHNRLRHHPGNPPAHGDDGQPCSQAPPQHRPRPRHRRRQFRPPRPPRRHNPPPRPRTPPLGRARRSQFGSAGTRAPSRPAPPGPTPPGNPASLGRPPRNPAHAGPNPRNRHTRAGAHPPRHRFFSKRQNRPRFSHALLVPVA
jgi:hypothetical protein